MEAWINEYLNRGQKQIIESLKDDAVKFSLSQLKNIEEDEKKNDNRRSVLSFLKNLIKGKKSDEKTTSVNIKTEEKNMVKKEERQYVKIAEKFKAMKGGITLRPPTGPVSIYWNRFTPVSQGAIDYLNDNWEDWQYEVIDEDEFKKRLKAQNDEIDRNKGDKK